MYSFVHLYLVFGFFLIFLWQTGLLDMNKHVHVWCWYNFILKIFMAILRQTKPRTRCKRVGDSWSVIEGEGGLKVWFPCCKNVAWGKNVTIKAEQITSRYHMEIRCNFVCLLYVFWNTSKKGFNRKYYTFVYCTYIYLPVYFYLCILYLYIAHDR